MPIVHYGAKGEPPLELEASNDLIVVRTRSGRSLGRAAGPVPSPLTAELADATLVASYPEAKVEVYRVPTGAGTRSVGDRKVALRASSDVRFAGGVLVDTTSRDPVLYTENLFVKFVDRADPDDCLAVLRQMGLTVKQQVDYATNAWFVEAPEGIGQGVFDVAQTLLARDDVEYCHPELIRPRARKAIATEQWHLRRSTIGAVVVDASANVEAAHGLTMGEGVTIAVIDDGIDIDHLEFAAPGKIVAPRDATEQSDDPRPKDPDGTGAERGENHGTACAGVACAGGLAGACGVAPKARLMPVRLASGLGSQREADAFKWAADHGADVISCSWGPPDGRWWDRNDPRHAQRVPLPASTRLAIDYVTMHGRDGKGCVVLFAAGNGNESVDNDGYASYARVTAVAACNDRGTRSVYSDFGNAVWCSFPSSDFGHAPFNHAGPLTPGIWTTDRHGTDGYNRGQIADGDAGGNYTNSFGGTSSSAPGAAGVAALVLSVNPALKWDEVKELLRRSCDRIDPGGAAYDPAGHSANYGYGRLNARTAVELARPQPRSEVVVNRRFDAAIPDLQTVSFPLQVADAASASSMVVRVDLDHTWIGDLVIKLKAPSGSGIADIMLHDRVGGSAKALHRNYDRSQIAALGSVSGRSCNGQWTLEVRDAAAQDSGTLVSWGLTIGLTAPLVPAAAPARGSEPAGRRVATRKAASSRHKDRPAKTKAKSRPTVSAR